MGIKQSIKLVLKRFAGLLRKERSAPINTRVLAILIAKELIPEVIDTSKRDVVREATEEARCRVAKMMNDFDASYRMADLRDKAEEGRTWRYAAHTLAAQNARLEAQLKEALNRIKALERI